MRNGEGKTFENDRNIPPHEDHLRLMEYLGSNPDRNSSIEEGGFKYDSRLGEQLSGESERLDKFKGLKLVAQKQDAGRQVA